MLGVLARFGGAVSLGLQELSGTGAGAAGKGGSHTPGGSRAGDVPSHIRFNLATGFP